MTISARFYRGLDGRVTVLTTSTGTSSGTASGLDPRRDLADWSRTLAWGSAGPEAQQLALALIADATGDGKLARALAAPFAQRLLAHIPAQEGWIISDSVVRGLCRLLGATIEARAA